MPGPDDNAAGDAAPETGVIVRFDGSSWRDTLGRSWDALVPFDLPDQGVYLANPPAQSGPTVLAALRKNMLGLAAEKADGAHPYFVPPEHTARARELLGPDKLLAPEQAILTIRDRGSTEHQDWIEVIAGHRFDRLLHGGGVMGDCRLRRQRAAEIGNAFAADLAALGDQ